MSKQSPNQISSRELTERLWVIVMRMLPFSTALPEVVSLVRDLTKQRTDLDAKIVKAHDALQETSTLFAELEHGLKDRVEKLEKIRADYEQYSKLAAVEEEKAKPIVQQIELTVGKGKGVERLISLGLNLLAGVIIFILGIYFGPKLATWLGIQVP